jgi:hypothetical protein
MRSLVSRAEPSPGAAGVTAAGVQRGTVWPRVANRSDLAAAGIQPEDVRVAEERS